MVVRKGIVKGFDVGAYQAKVQVAGSLAMWLDEMPVARNIPSGDMVVGRSCAVLFFDEANPKDAVLFAVWE